MAKKYVNSLTKKLTLNPNLADDMIIVIDNSNLIIDGNHKLMAMYNAGILKVKYINIDDVE